VKAAVAVAIALLSLGCATRDRSFRTSDGVRIHYVDVGRGTTFVLVPGWTMPADVFAPQLEALSITHRVIAVDPRAQGRSEAPRNGHDPERRARDLCELLAATDARDVVLVGWSLGAADVLSYVQQFGGTNLAGVVLVDAPITQEMPPKRLAGFVATLSRFQTDRHAYAEAFVRNLFKQAPDDAYRARLVRAVENVPADAAVALVMNTMTRDWSDAIRDVHVPLLYVVTKPMATQASVVTELSPNARIEIFENAGHALFVDEPLRFNALLAEFAQHARVHHQRAQQ
jgi:microsomal epoxide hydrolase